jgi:Ca2+-transporting ATPase
MKGNPAAIIKEGKLTLIDELELRAGDEIVVQVGDIVPADIRLTEAVNLEVDEFEITGELLPVNKQVGDSEEFLYMGSKITKGRGRGIVLRVGEHTEYGRVLKQQREKEKKIEVVLFRLKYLALPGLLVPAVLFHLLRGDLDVLASLLFITLSFLFILLQNDRVFYYCVLTHAIKKLARLAIQVRDPNQLEYLHQVDTVFFDKTGVLTARKIKVGSYFLVDPEKDAMRTGAGNADVVSLIQTACALCNDVHYLQKLSLANQIDQALINFALEQGMDYAEITSQYKRIDDLPFDSENRYMAGGFLHSSDEMFYFAKGDPEVITKMCDGILLADGSYQQMNFDILYTINSQVDHIIDRGSSVIALAYNHRPHRGKPGKYTFLCLLELENPLHPDARGIIRELSSQKRRSILVTGDKPQSALRVAADSGINQVGDACLTGRLIKVMDLAEVSRQSSYCSVFAQLTPSQKGILAYLFQLKGHRIAMIGDGPNDGVALKVADVGISFNENSSPIARNLSKILINDLADILVLFKSARRVHRDLILLKVVSILTIVLALACVYSSLLF